MKKFFSVVTVTTILCTLVSTFLLVGSVFPDSTFWFGLVVFVSMMIMGITGTAEWIYEKGSKDEYKRHRERNEARESE